MATRTPLVTALFVLFAVLLPLRAQDPELTKMITDFSLGFDHNDAPTMDKALKPVPAKAIEYYQVLRVDIWSGRKGEQAKADALKEAFARAFQKATPLEKLDRWIEAQDKASYERYRKAREALTQCYRLLGDAEKDGKRPTFESARDQTLKIVQAMEETGHKKDAAEGWLLWSIIASKMPDRTAADMRDTVDGLQRFVQLRDDWEFTQDTYYARNAHSLKTEKEKLERKVKDDKERGEAGYKANSKGIEALVMPDAKDDLKEMTFAMLPGWEGDLDYYGQGGPLPQFWSLEAVKKEPQQINWFRRLKIYLVRLGAAKYAVSLKPDDPKFHVEIDAGSKGKPTLFHLDPDKKIPYAMFFWTGTDKEMVGEASVNMLPTAEQTSIYYRSAASWTCTFGQEQLTFYDDNATGNPLDGDTWSGEYKVQTLGKPDVVVPQLDSMRIGKGPRVPFSEFAFLNGAWWYMHRVEQKVGFMPLNPKYVKTGKVKLAWAGPKPTAPVQLVIQGNGDYATAAFDIASGKEVEVPAGEYRVIYGRILQGKGQKTQMATIYQGEAKTFQVEEAKTCELKMGAPFSIHFEKGGNDNEVVIDSTHLTLHESSGCILANLQGMTLVPEVWAAKAADGKGAKMIGKFVKLEDPELLNKAATKNGKVALLAAFFPMPEGMKDGSLELKAKLPAAGMKVQLKMAKHPLFGALASPWQ